jgi:hypothetical protein
VIGGPALPGTPCDDGNSATYNDEWDVNCICTGNTCPDNPIVLEITTDGNGSQTWWEILPSAGGAALASGGTGGTYPSNTTFTEEVCLPDGCFQLIFHDTGNNGMCCAFGNGGYVLWDPNGDAIIDNRTGTGAGDGVFTSTSSIKNNTDFCLPLGPVTMTNYPAPLSHDLYRVDPFCGNAPSVPLQAIPDFAIGGALGLPTTEGYRFQFFDPDGHGVGARRGWTYNANPCVVGGWLPFGYLKVTNLREVDNGPFALNAIALPVDEQCSYENPSAWISNLPPLDIWLNVRVARVINGVAENYGPVSRIEMSAPTSFRGEVPLSSAEFNEALRSGISVLPNPSADGLVQVWLPNVTEVEEVAIRLLDITGREMVDHSFATNGEGDLQLMVNWADVPAGMYIIQAHVGAQIRSTRLVLE